MSPPWETVKQVPAGEAGSRRALGNTARRSPVRETVQGTVPCLRKARMAVGTQEKGRTWQCGSPQLSRAVMKGASQHGTEYCLEFVNPSRADSVWEARKYLKILNSVSLPYWNFHFIPWLSSKCKYYITGCQAQLTLNKQSMHVSQLKHFEPCFNTCIIIYNVLHTCDTNILYMDVLLPGLNLELGSGLRKTEVANILLAVN